MNAPATFSGTRPLPEKLVVIGNGMAGCRAVEELLAREPGRYAITIFGAEPRVNYNRIMLSPVLAGDKTQDDIVLHPRAWYAEHGITLHTGDPVVAIDRRRRIVRSQSGVEVAYDRLLLATGSQPFIVPVPARTCRAWWAFATWMMSTRCCRRRAMAGTRW